MVTFIIIIATIAIEIILGYLIIRNPNRFIGEGKPDTLMKVFLFGLLSLMIVVLVYLTIAGIKG